MSKTCTVYISNSDNKLTQVEYSQFILSVDLSLKHLHTTIHFKGGSAAESAYQNYCWVFATESLDGFLNNLQDIKRQFKQDSIALTIGDTQFI